MLLRIRWFVLGAIASFGAVAYVANQLRRMRQAMTPSNLARGGARAAADVLELVSERLSPTDVRADVPSEDLAESGR